MYEAALTAIKAGTTGAERDKALRELAEELKTPKAKSSTLNAIAAVLAQIADPDRFKSDETSWQAHDATERNFRRWKANIKRVFPHSSSSGSSSSSSSQAPQGKAVLPTMMPRTLFGAAPVDCNQKEQAVPDISDRLLHACWECHTSDEALADLLPDTLDTDPFSSQASLLDGRRELGDLPEGRLSPVEGLDSVVEGLDPVDAIEDAFALCVGIAQCNEPTGGASVDGSPHESSPTSSSTETSESSTPPSATAAAASSSRLLASGVGAYAKCRRERCICVSFDGQLGHYCCKTCRDGKACVHRDGSEHQVHSVPSQSPRSTDQLPAGAFAPCVRTDCQCTASFDGRENEHCCLTCKEGQACLGNWHPTPQRRSRKGVRLS